MESPGCMSNWNEIYSGGSIHSRPSKEVTGLIPLLKKEGVCSILDAGCGTGRHSQLLAKNGFSVYGIDISDQAIQLARANKNGYTVDYIVGSLTDLPYPQDSMDFILANHSLEYASKEDVQRSFAKLDNVLRQGRIFFARVASTQHPFCHADPEEVYGFSHIGFCIKNGLPVHFFDEEELRDMFKDYKIERLEHITHKIDHDKISVPLSEWILLGYKR